MSITCECGEKLSGDTCMLCGWTASDNNVYAEVTPGQDGTDLSAANITHDEQQSGTLGDSALDISCSIHIMDLEGNTIFDIPYEEAKCSTDLLGGLCIKHNGIKTRLTGPDIKAWKQAISFKMKTPVWYIHGDEDCELLYGDIILGVTPCIINPPFSWDAFRTGSYNITVRRPGGKPVNTTIQCKTCSPTIRYKGGEPASRTGPIPQGEELVLNGSRKLVKAEIPYLVDSNGVVVLPMPGAYADIKFLKRGATISWRREGIGVISIPIQCNNKIKYDRLKSLLPKPKTEKSRGKKKKPTFNRGRYKGTNLRVTSQDIETRLGRFADGYTFECVCANTLSAMGYNIEKGYDVRTDMMKGATTSDMGVDILAVKGDKRIVVQCKHWQNQCGGPDVNKTIGSASTHDSNTILMICTGGFTTQAKEVGAQSTTDVQFWDWDTLCLYMKKHLI